MRLDGRSTRLLVLHPVQRPGESLLVKNRALSDEYRALLIKYMALWLENGALLEENGGEKEGYTARYSTHKKRIF